MPRVARAELESLLQGPEARRHADDLRRWRILAGGSPRSHRAAGAGRRARRRAAPRASLRDRRSPIVGSNHGALCDLGGGDRARRESSRSSIRTIASIRRLRRRPASIYRASSGSGTAGDALRALKAMNLVLQAGGFGVVAFDLADVRRPALRQFPMTTWMRLSRVIESSQTVALLIGRRASGAESGRRHHRARRGRLATIVERPDGSRAADARRSSSARVVVAAHGYSA